MINYYFEALMRLFYPAKCEMCRGGLELREPILCPSCAAELDALAWPLEHALADGSFESLDNVWTVYAYASPLRELLHGVKYSRKDYLLKVFRDRLAALAQAVTSELRYDAILPIPIGRLKRVRRHYNQTEILAETLTPSIMVPAKRGFLLKRRKIPSQTSLSQQERAINVYGAFKLRTPSRAAGGSFLLLDDVLTTGATANEAARLLKLHGARRVDLLALARTATPEEKTTILSASSQGKRAYHAMPLGKTV